MNSAEFFSRIFLRPWPRMAKGICSALTAVLVLPFSAFAATDQYSFELDEFEKKSFQWNGYLETTLEHRRKNQDSAFARLSALDRPADDRLDKISAAVQLSGSYNRDTLSLHWTIQGTAEQDDHDWDDTVDLFEGYGSFQPTRRAAFVLGKKSFKWGKGYAWNPVGFINRSKDPENPEEALEGYVTATADLVRSFSGPLRTAALTVALLPVWQGVNEDFGHADHVNGAARISLLYRDTDIDFLMLVGASRATGFGMDFSRNLATNIEVHGELAFTAARERKWLSRDNTLQSRAVSDTSYLAGIRYLTETDLTAIIEYYHNGDGFAPEELDRFYQAVADGHDRFLATGSTDGLQRAKTISMTGYGAPQPGRDYLYARFSQKEPFDILYLTPAFTAIVNLGDMSASCTPEIIYTGVTNLEMRLRLTLLVGHAATEYGEKMNTSKLEARLRYFF